MVEAESVSVSSGIRDDMMKDDTLGWRWIRAATESSSERVVEISATVSRFAVERGVRIPAAGVSGTSARRIAVCGVESSDSGLRGEVDSVGGVRGIERRGVFGQFERVFCGRVCGSALAECEAEDAGGFGRSEMVVWANDGAGEGSLDGLAERRAEGVVEDAFDVEVAAAAAEEAEVGGFLFGLPMLLVVVVVVVVVFVAAALAAAAEARSREPLRIFEVFVGSTPPVGPLGAVDGAVVAPDDGGSAAAGPPPPPPAAAGEETLIWWCILLQRRDAAAAIACRATSVDGAQRMVGRLKGLLLPGAVQWELCRWSRPDQWASGERDPCTSVGRVFRYRCCGWTCCWRQGRVGRR